MGSRRRSRPKLPRIRECSVGVRAKAIGTIYSGPVPETEAKCVLGDGTRAGAVPFSGYASLCFWTVWRCWKWNNITTWWIAEKYCCLFLQISCLTHFSGITGRNREGGRSSSYSSKILNWGASRLRWGNKFDGSFYLGLCVIVSRETEGWCPPKVGNFHRK